MAEYRKHIPDAAERKARTQAMGMLAEEMRRFSQLQSQEPNRYMKLHWRQLGEYCRQRMAHHVTVLRRKENDDVAQEES